MSVCFLCHGLSCCTFLLSLFSSPTGYLFASNYVRRTCCGRLCVAPNPPTLQLAYKLKASWYEFLNLCTSDPPKQIKPSRSLGFHNRKAVSLPPKCRLVDLRSEEVGLGTKILHLALFAGPNQYPPHTPAMMLIITMQTRQDPFMILHTIFHTHMNQEDIDRRRKWRQTYELARTHLSSTVL